MEQEEEGEPEGEGEGGGGLPRGTVVRLARAAAGGVALSNEVQTALVASCELFVGRVTQRALQQCAQHKRSMLVAHDVEEACQALGFDYHAQLAEVAGAMETKQKAAKLRRSQQSAVSPEEKARLQASQGLIGVADFAHFPGSPQELMFAEAANAALNK